MTPQLRRLARLPELGISLTAGKPSSFIMQLAVAGVANEIKTMLFIGLYLIDGSRLSDG